MCYADGGNGKGRTWMNSRKTAHEILRTLETCLMQLDGLGFEVSAAHVDTAIHALRLEIGPDDADAGLPPTSG